MVVLFGAGAEALQIATGGEVEGTDVVHYRRHPTRSIMQVVVVDLIWNSAGSGGTGGGNGAARLYGSGNGENGTANTGGGGGGGTGVTWSKSRRFWWSFL